MKRQYPMGSVSQGTMRPEDLIPIFLKELRSHRPLTRMQRQSAREIEQRLAVEGYYQTQEANYDLGELFDILNGFSAPYFYFGSQRGGDGSDYGYWLTTTFREDCEGIQVSDLSEIPRGYRGEVILINDHGNMTLYNRGRNGRLQEIWSVV